MRYKTQKIIDEFTDLPVSRQRKHQLRHPELYREKARRFRRNHPGYDKRYLTPEGKIKRQAWVEKNKQNLKLYAKTRNEFLLECRDQLMIILDLYDL